MIDRTLIEKLAADAMEGTGCFLVSLKIGNANEIHVEIDGDEGVKVSDCVNVSRGIEHNLDREQEDFSLKVTSPGADQPLSNWRQYNQHIGRKVKVETAEGTELKGELLAVSDSGIRIKTEPSKKGKGKNKVVIDAEELEINKENIASTKVVLSFK